jgi:hypothetical protein
VGKEFLSSRIEAATVDLTREHLRAETVGTRWLGH